jgi:hypothetical protein
MSEGVIGNPEDLNYSELHRSAWTIVEPLFLKSQKVAVDRFKQFAETEMASHDIKVVIPAAYFGKVEILFVPIGIHQWGIFDPKKNIIYLHESAETDDEDLLDLAAIQTYLHSGTVYAVEPKDMPDNLSVAAIFRY